MSLLEDLGALVRALPALGEPHAAWSAAETWRWFADALEDAAPDVVDQWQEPTTRLLLIGGLARALTDRWPGPVAEEAFRDAVGTSVRLALIGEPPAVPSRSPAGTRLWHAEVTT
jgi:hypothetical protein